MKILYLEDNRYDAELALRALREAGDRFEVEVVALMADARARLNGHTGSSYDLVLTDLSLPDGDGLELLSHIRTSEAPCAVVVVTGRSDEETVISALKAGADDYLIKRGDYLSRLPATLDAALERHRLEAEVHARPLRVLFAVNSRAEIEPTLAHMQKYAAHIRVEIASTPEAVLAELPAGRPAGYDVIVLDHSIADLRAFEVLKEIRQVRQIDVPVVVVTRQGSEEIVLQATRLGAYDYLVKNPGYLFHLPAVIENAYHRHRLAEEHAALREAEREHRRLVEQVPGAIYRCRIDETCSSIFMSPQIEALTGYGSDEWIADPRLWEHILHPEDRERVLSENLETNRTGEPFKLEYRVLARDGHVVWIRDEALMIRDPAGQAQFWQGVMVDISDRMRSEQALHRRDAIMEAVSFAAEKFLSSRWEDSIHAVLGRLCAAAGVSRAYIFENLDAADGEVRSRQIYEWTAPGVSPQIGNADLQQFSFAGNGLEQLSRVLKAGSPVHARLSELEPDFRSLLEAQGIRSIVCVPIFDGGEWWGFIGLDDCEEEREWPFPEIEALRAAANILGAAIRREHAEEALQRQLEELGILHSVAIDATQASSLDDLIERVTATLGRRLYPDNFGILLADETGSRLILHPSYTGISQEEARRAIPVRSGITGRVFRSGQPARVADVRRDPDYVVLRPDILSEVCVPIQSGDRLIGVINVESLRPNFFSDDDERLLVTIAGQLATAFEKIRLLEVERQQLHESEILRQAAAVISTSLELQSVLRMIQSSLKQVLPFDGSTLFLIESDTLKAAARDGFSNRTGVGERSSRDWGPLFDEIFREREVIIIPDADADPRFRRWTDEPIRSWMGIPLIARDEVIGFLTIDSYTPAAYSPRQAVLAETYAHQAAAAINNARLFEQTSLRLRELEVVNRISTSLRVANTAAEMLPLLLDETLSVLDLQAGAIWLHDASQDVLSQSAARGWFAHTGEKQIRSNRGLPGYVFSLGKPYLAADIRADEHLDPVDRELVPEGWTCAGIPIHAASAIIGVLFVSGPSPRKLRDDEIGLLNTLAEIAGTAIHRVFLYNKTERQVRHLVALRDIDIAISSSFDLRVTLDVLLDHALGQLEVDAADILLLNPHAQTLEIEVMHGFRATARSRSRFRLGEGFAGRIALERRMQIVPDIRIETGRMRLELLTEGFVSYVGIPLVAKGQTKGVLEIFNRSPMNPTSDWLEFLQAIASQAAIAIDNAQLFNNLQRSNLELALAYDTTLEGWGKALELRDPETEGHTLRVTHLALKLAAALNVDPESLVHIRRGALLHDIGKMGVPDPVLRKTGGLTESEWEIMRNHVIYAYDLLRPIDYLQKALDIPYCHHERWNGEGYPRGLKGEEIPEAARIFAVVDVWDALMSDRPYRDAWPREQVIEYIRQESGRMFDPRMALVFLELVERGEVD